MHKSSPLVLIYIQINSVHDLKLFFLKGHLNCPSIYSLVFKVVSFLQSPRQIDVCDFLPNTCHKPSPSRLVKLDINEFVILQFSSTSRYLLLLEHNQPMYLTQYDTLSFTPLQNYTRQQSRLHILFCNRYFPKTADIKKYIKKNYFLEILRLVGLLHSSFFYLLTSDERYTLSYLITYLLTY